MDLEGSDASLWLVLVKSGLAQKLEDDDRYGVGQIQTPGGSRHRNVPTSCVIIYQHFRSQARSLFAEHDPVTPPEFSLVNGPFSRRFDHKNPTGVRHPSAPVPIGAVLLPSQITPVIEPRPLHPALGDLESHRFDQMELRAGAHTGSGNIAGIFWDQRLDQHHPTQRVRVGLRFKPRRDSFVHALPIHQPKQSRSR
jgi:hypothetical protein